MAVSKAFDIFPDIEAMAGAIMRTAGVCSGRVYPSVPKEPVYPLVVFRRFGGVPTDRHALDYGRIQVDVWGDTKVHAREQASLARLALLKAEGTTLVALNGFISSVEDELGLSFQPDPETGRDRYIFGVAITARSSTGLVT